MRLTAASVAALLTLGTCHAGASSSASISRDGDGVLVLTARNWDVALAQHDPLFINFYAPDCDYCELVAPEWAAAARSLASEGLVLAKMDVAPEAERPIAVTYLMNKSITLPALCWIKGGVPSQYHGERNAVRCCRVWVQEAG